MTRKELARHDGREGRQALVAVNGKVYDFTDSPLWRNGSHEDRHSAGCDLTEELKGAPHVRAVIERFRVVDILEEETVAVPNRRMKKIFYGVGIVLLLVLLFLVLR